MIILVVSMHAAVTYSTFGSWYYNEARPQSRLILVLFVTYQAYLQAFFMGVLFFVAGCFVPRSYDRKGAAAFVRDRAYRLGWPALLYMLVIGPLTEYFVSQSWRPAEPSSFGREWIKHLRDGEWLSESGPLWFCIALLCFSVVYAVVRWLRPLRSKAPREATRPGTPNLILFVLVISLATFLVRLVQPSGSAFFNMQLANFSQYIAMFTAGILAGRQGWLARLPKRAAMRWFNLALAGGLIWWFTLVLAGGALKGRAADYGGGLHWQGALVDLWESFVCVGISFGLLVWFRDHYNHQGALEQFLSENAFCVYVFHPPVLIAITRLLHLYQANPLLKFALATVLAVSATYALSATLLRRIPLLRAIL